MKKYLISFVIAFIVFGSLLGAISTTSSATGGGQPFVETQTYWVNQSSQLVVTPGMNDIPLFASFEATSSSMNNLLVNMSIGLNYNGSGPLSESYVHGLNRKVTDYENYIYQAGKTYTAYQLVNISANYSSGLYTEFLNYTVTNITKGTQVARGQIPFQIDIAGSINLEVSAVYFTFDGQMIEPEPGLHNGLMHIVLENAGTGSIVNASISYMPQYPFSGHSYVLNVPGIEAFGILNITVPVNISESAGYGNYNISLNVSYDGTNHYITRDVVITGYSSIMLIQYHTNPLIVYEGEKYVALDAEIINNGTSPLFNEPVSFTGAFKTLAGNFTLPALMPGAVMNLTFYFNSPYAHGMIYPSLKIGSSIFSIPVYIHEGAKISVTSGSFNFNPGQSKAVMTFVFTNTGNRTAYDIQIHLLSPSILSIHVSSSNPLGALTANNVTIGSLAPGMSFTVTFIVDLSGSASTGTYSSQIAYSYMYNDSTSRFNQFYNFDFHVVPTELQNIQQTVNPSNIIFDGVIIILLVLILSGLLVAAKRRKNKTKGKK
ncbi:COG1361 S-layer family protein [Cuniculiplasma sp. SKW4]|uniref:COG1361 S-layer family protein n=1 Tax=Cuniculiplasma sp. SKW4 TaxID=3400171 RepID=UPI003FD282CA